MLSILSSVISHAQIVLVVLIQKNIASLTVPSSEKDPGVVFCLPLPTSSLPATGAGAGAGSWA